MSKKHKKHKQNQAEPKKTSNTKETNSPGFPDFLKEKTQKNELLIFAALYALIYFLYVSFYPYPGSSGDTGNFILCAKRMTIGGYRPIGYSWFLNFFHSINESLHFTVFCQYLFNAVASLFFIFTVKYFFKPVRKTLFYIFAALVILNPFAIYLTNILLSGTIFNSLTIIWVVTGLWLNQTKGITRNSLILGLHLLAMFLAIKTRYAAIFYPVVSFAWIFLAYNRKKWSLVVGLLPIIVGISIYFQTKSEMKEHIGIETFSAFGGWAQANNAVSIIPYIDLKPEEIEDRRLRFVHSVVTSYPDSVYTTKRILGTDFMWEDQFAGKRILATIQKRNRLSYVRSWVYSGELFREYAWMLISKYPFKYLKHFIWPNTKSLFSPHGLRDYFHTYKPDRLQKSWYNLSIEKHKFKHSFFQNINPFIKVLYMSMWVIFFGSIIYLGSRWKHLNLSSYQKSMALVITIFILMYMGFSIIAHPINNFRYITPMVIFQFFLGYLAVNEFLDSRKIIAKNN